jgi:hypothetical protein
MFRFEKASAGSEWSEVAMKAPLRKWGLVNRQTEGLRVRGRKEEAFRAHSHLPKVPGRREAVKSDPVTREPRRRGRRIRNTAIAATLLNGLLVTSVIMLIAMLVPGGLPTANVGEESTGDAAAEFAYQELVEQGLAVAENKRESEPPSAAKQSVAGLIDSIRVPAQRDQPAAIEAASNWSAAAIEEVLAATEEPNESSSPTRTIVAAGRDASSLPPVDNASTASTAHPVAASSSILQKRPPTDQSALPDTEFPDPLVEAPAFGAEGRRPGAQAPDASNKSADAGVRMIKFGEQAVATVDPTTPIEPESPATAATEPSGNSEHTAGVHPQPADARPDEFPETGGAGAFANLDEIGEQPSAGAIAEQTEPDVATAGAEVTSEVTRSAPVTATVNMRAGPDLDAAVITVVSAGTEVGVIGCDSWCEVVFGGERGWIYQSFVSDGLLNGNSSDVARSGSTDAGASGGGGTNGDLGGSGTAHAQSASEAAAAVDMQIAAGTPLISADGAPIGMVREFHTDANGQTFVVVDLTEGVGIVPSIRLRVEHVLAAGQHARLNFTRAQFVNALPQSAAEASAGIDTNLADVPAP